MKMKFEIEMGMGERLTYSMNNRSSDGTISTHENNRIHEIIDKVLIVFKE